MNRTLPRDRVVGGLLDLPGHVVPAGPGVLAVDGDRADAYAGADVEALSCVSAHLVEKRLLAVGRLADPAAEVGVARGRVAGELDLRPAVVEVEVAVAGADRDGAADPRGQLDVGLCRRHLAVQARPRH